MIPNLPKPYYQDDAVTIYHADCREILPLLKRESVELVLADPPFNAGKNYGSETDDAKPKGEYLEWLRSCFEAVWEPLTPGGTLWVMNDTRWIGYCQAILDEHYTFLNLIVWTYGNPTPAMWGLAKTWRPILLYCKGSKPNHFDATASPLSAHPQLYWNPSHAAGGLCHDIWPDIPKLVGGFLSQDEVILNRDGTFAHLTQMPEALAKRPILLASLPNQTILDPFMGSGTTLRAAKDLGRKAIGIEIEERYCAIAAERMAQGVMVLEL